MKKIVAAVLSSALILTGTASTLAAGISAPSGDLEVPIAFAADAAVSASSFLQSPQTLSDSSFTAVDPESEAAAPSLTSTDCPNRENCPNNGNPPRDGSGYGFGAQQDGVQAGSPADCPNRENCSNNGNPPRDGSGYGFGAQQVGVQAGDQTSGPADCSNRENCPNNGNPPRDGSGSGYGAKQVNAQAVSHNQQGAGRQRNCQNR